MKKLNKILILLLALFLTPSSLSIIKAEDSKDNNPQVEVEEVLAKAKTEANTKLSDHALTIKNVDKVKLAEVSKAASSKINAATTVDQVNLELEKGIQALNNIEKIIPPEPEKPKPPVEDKPTPPQTEPVLSENNYLSTLTVSGESFIFTPETTTYRLVVDNPISSVRVTASAQDSSATVVGGGLKYLNVYDNEVFITVTSERGSDRIYTLNIVRRDSEGNEEEDLYNNDLLSLIINECDLDFDRDIFNYKCEVDHLTTKVNIVAKAIDKEAKVEIESVDKLEVGDNLIKIKVIASNGDIKTYTVTVIRSESIDQIDIKDLAKALESIDVDEITVLLDSQEMISKFLMQKIKQSKKTIYFNKEDKNNNLLYTWKIDGANITFVDNLYTRVALDKKDNPNLGKLTKDYSGLILAFEDNPSLPLNTKVKINVGDRFKNQGKLNLYYYDSLKDDLSLQESDLKIQDEMVWLNLSHTSEYFLTSENLKVKNSSLNTSFIISLLIFVLLLLIGFREVIKRGRKRRIVSDYLDEDEVNLSLSEEEFANVVWGSKRKTKNSK